jgi:hypothetical protein
MYRLLVRGVVQTLGSEVSGRLSEDAALVRQLVGIRAAPPAEARSSEALRSGADGARRFAGPSAGIATASRQVAFGTV